MSDHSGIRANRPSQLNLLDRVKRLLSRQRSLRRLDGEPLRQDFLGGRHTVSYLRHLARGNAIPRKHYFSSDAQGAATAATPTTSRKGILTDRESRPGSAVDDRESRPGSAVDDRESRSGSAVDDRGARRPGSAVIDDLHPPVLLIHGFLGTRGSMFVLEQRLLEDRFNVVSFNLGVFNTRDIRSSAFLIQRKIQSILDQTQVRRIDIVGHSMGGLIGLYYIKRLGGHQRVRRLVMMGSPVRGTWAALLGVATIGLFSSSSWQLLPGSRFLTELAAGPLPEDVEFTTIAAERDWVCPPQATQMEGAHGVTVPLGHSSLVVSEEVYQKVLWALRKEDAPR